MDETVHLPVPVDVPKPLMRDEIAKTLIVGLLGFALNNLISRNYDKYIIERRANKPPKN